jgi:hypothetical protein
MLSVTTQTAGNIESARPCFEVADIFRDYGEQYRRSHPLPRPYLKVMHAIEVCRTAYLGGHVERCFEDEKSELGFSHFEVRNYLSLRRHLILTAVSHLFLAKVHQQWREEKSRIDCLPGSYGLFSISSIIMTDRASAREVLGIYSTDYIAHPATISSFSSQPFQEEMAFIA